MSRNLTENYTFQDVEAHCAFDKRLMCYIRTIKKDITERNISV